MMAENVPMFTLTRLSDGERFEFVAPVVAAFYAKRKMKSDDEYAGLLSSDDATDKMIVSQVDNAAHAAECIRFQKVDGIKAPTKFTFAEMYKFLNEYQCELIFPKSEDGGQAEENPSATRVGPS
jgi:hypothetical protein